MNHDKTLFFTGIDWGSVSHQVCVTDQDGSVLREKAFKHGGEGLFEMAEWMLEVSGSSPENIAVAIEVNHGPVVETLLEHGFRVRSVNPKQLDRFRDRFSPSGAKDDRRDARVLASALRTDGGHFRRLEPQDPDIAVLRELNRTREELVTERTRMVNRLRQLFWGYYPQLNEVAGKVFHPWLLELWELAPTPAAARRIRKSSVQKILKNHRIRRISAEGVVAILRSKEISLPEAIVQSRVAHVRTLAERMKIIDRQMKETVKLADDMVNSIELRQKAQVRKGKPTDIEILRSIPGIGRIILITLLAEAYDLIRRRDYKALRCLAGVAPVTKQSGKTRYVTRRRSASRRLVEALHRWAAVAALCDPVSRVKYASLRARGLRYYRSLRAVGDRLLYVTCALLDKGELFDKEFKKPTQAEAA